ncbi:MAG: outer membrane lipoprotein carrier protein LolA [Cyclobacteriaceae bacterium]|nr:outer membrane lipoprotein carrier protein LolA [Cyclobacteriaceae bacterium]
MKNALILIVVTFLFTGVYAQNDPKAKEILDQMSEKYKSFTSFKAGFVNKLENEIEGFTEEFEGQIVVKGTKYKLIVGDQEIYNNGTTVWTYLKDINEVNIDNYVPEDGDMTPSNIYNIYKSGYKYRLMEERREGSKLLQLVELQPENPKQSKSQFINIILRIDKTDKTLNGWTIKDRTGNQYSYTITNFTPNVEANDKTFEFDPSKHPDVEIVDLR